MENKISVEEKVDSTLESLKGIHSVEIPDGFEAKMMVRFDAELYSKKRMPKFFWTAAVLLLAINILAVINYSTATNSISNNIQTTKTNSSPQQQVANYYFNGGTSWY